MKTFNEKAKKLEDVLKKLNQINPKNTYVNKKLELLQSQKNQLEIENSELQSKYNILEEEHDRLKIRLDKIQAQKENKFANEKKFEKKIDELNQ